MAYEPKYETQVVDFTDYDQAAEARREINDMQNSIQMRLFNYGCVLAGLINIPFAIAAAAIADDANSSLEELEDFYSEIGDALESGEYTKVVVTQKWKGTWRGNNRGYVYAPMTPKAKYVV